MIMIIIMIITTMITRYQDICRGLPAAPTTSTILNAATTIMAEISTSIQQVIGSIKIRIRINENFQSGECGRSTWNSSHDPRWVKDDRVALLKFETEKAKSKMNQKLFEKFPKSIFTDPLIIWTFSISMPTVCTNTSDPGEGVTMQVFLIRFWCDLGHSSSRGCSHAYYVSQFWGFPDHGQIFGLVTHCCLGINCLGQKLPRTILHTDY